MWRSGGIVPRVLNFDSKWRWVVSLTRRPRVSCCQVAYWAIPSAQRVIRYTTGERIWIYLVQNPDRKHLDFRAIRDEHAPKYSLYVTSRSSSNAGWQNSPGPKQHIPLGGLHTGCHHGDCRDFRWQQTPNVRTAPLLCYCVHNKQACGDIHRL